MNITKDFLIEKFNEFNDAYFNNEIEMVEFGFSKTRRRLGCYYSNLHKIEITTYFPNITKHDVEKILIHEMCHAYLRCTNNEDEGFRRSHGKNFYNIARRVNIASNNKYCISRLTRLSDESKMGIKQRAAKNIIILVCRSRYEKNLVHVGKVTSNAMYEMQSWLWNTYDQIEAYKVAENNASTFSRWQTGKKIFHSYRFTEDGYNEKIKPCIDYQLTFRKRETWSVRR